MAPIVAHWPPQERPVRSRPALSTNTTFKFHIEVTSKYTIPPFNLNIAVTFVLLAIGEA